MRGAVAESLRRTWRWPLLALALLLAACQTSSGGNILSRIGAPVDNLPPPAPPGPTVTEELFQPTVHAILAMSGGFGNGKIGHCRRDRLAANRQRGALHRLPGAGPRRGEDLEARPLRPGQGHGRRQ